MSTYLQRTAAGTADWLARHPAIEVVSRDRCGLYAQGAREGAPQAKQVADRFHLLQNLRQIIEQQLSRNAGVARAGSHIPSSSEALAQPDLEQDEASSQEILEHRRLVKKGLRRTLEEMFGRVKQMQAQGSTMATIVRETGLNWRTVAKWARQDVLAKRNTMGAKSSTPLNFHKYLKERWNEGCRTGRHLLPEIKQIGYTGSLSHLERLLQKFRNPDERDPIIEPIDERADIVSTPMQPTISSIVAAALCVKPRSLLTKHQVEKVEILKNRSFEFRVMRQLAMRFQGLLKGHDPAKLETWLYDAHHSKIYSMRRFVRTLRQDVAAVRNAIVEKWSNGQAEGQINRLKTLKRAMYGRASTELLRARMMPLRL